MKAVIDRFEDQYAVTLCGDREIRVDIPVELLPTGAKEGSWLRIDLELDTDETAAREDKIRELLEKLKKKGEQ